MIDAEPNPVRTPSEEEVRIRAVVVRHGQSVWNAARIYQGHGGPGLTELGAEQAERTAKYLNDTVPAVGLVARSDLERVVETSAPIQAAYGVEVAEDPRLREIDIGTWTGKRREEILEFDAERLLAVNQGADLPRGGAETFADLRARSWSGHAAAVAAAAGRTRTGDTPPVVVIVTHGGPIRMVTAEALGVPGGHEALIRGPENCSITVLDHDVAPDGVIRRSVLTSYNDHGHLSGLLPT